jgi:hypothetical protein
MMVEFEDNPSSFAASDPEFVPGQPVPNLIVVVLATEGGDQPSPPHSGR